MTAFHATDPDEWRAWLAGNSRSAKEIWLVIRHRGSATPGVHYHEAIEQALCYGWIDSHARSHDTDSSLLRFTPRGPRSSWSEVNRQRAARMTELGLMTEQGAAAIELAKAAGRWQVVPAVLPPDLRESLALNDAARTNFERFPPSSKRLILEWVTTAKKPETRQRRIEQTVTLAAENLRANHPATRTGKRPDEPVPSYRSRTLSAANLSASTTSSLVRSGRS